MPIPVTGALGRVGDLREKLSLCIGEGGRSRCGDKELVGDAEVRLS